MLIRKLCKGLFSFIISRSSYIKIMLFFKKSIRHIKLLQGFHDIHSHLLYGVDDGSHSIDESLQALFWQESQGITTQWLTPHIMEDMPNSTQELKNRFNKLKTYYTGNIKLNLAAEYMLDSLFRTRYQNNDLLPIAGKYLLTETAFLNPVLGFDFMLYEICTGSYRPILAHPERYLYMSEADYKKYKKRGVLYQLNLLSLTGLYGKSAYQKSHELLKKGMYDFIGTDIHLLRVLQKEAEKTCLSSREAALLLKLSLNNQKLDI